MTQGHKDTVNVLILDGDHLFSASDDKSVIIWDVEAETMLHEVKFGHRVGLMLLSDRMLVVGTNEGTVHFYDYPRDTFITKFKKKVPGTQPG